MRFHVGRRRIFKKEPRGSTSKPQKKRAIRVHISALSCLWRSNLQPLPDRIPQGRCVLPSEPEQPHKPQCVVWSSKCSG